MSQVPLVVVVLVAHDPGDWFEEAMLSLAHSNYPNLEVVVVDNASTSSVEARIGRYLPLARVVRLPEDRGYARACNEGAAIVEGATHLIFCHDDVALAPDAITEMMEVAFAENAGIVTPKVMVWDSPRQILQFGLDLDRSGAVASRVEVGDLDQSQYDQIEEVFVAPGGCTLIRNDLFSALGGFDVDMELFYEDVDLSWRAHLLGARVVTAPSAKVRHLMVATNLPVVPRRRRAGMEPTGRTGVGHLKRLQYSRKNQLRVLMKDSDGRQRRGLILRFTILSTLEILYYLVTGRPRLSKVVISALATNFKHRKEIASLRSELKAQSFTGGRYQVKFISGSAKISAYLATRRSISRINRSRDDSGQVPLGFRYVSERTQSPDVPRRTPERLLSRTASIVIWVTVAGYLVATRSLISGHIPLLGGMASLPSPGYFLSHFFTSSYQMPLFGHQPAPTIWLIFGLVEFVFFGSSSIMLHAILVLGPLLGSLGAFRLVASRRGRDAGKISAALYLLMPILHQALLASSLQAVLAISIVPWTIHFLIRARTMASGSRRQVRKAYIAAGLALGLTAAVSPALWIVLVLTVLVVTVPFLLSKQHDAARGGMKILIVASVFSVFLNLPWTISLLWPGHPVASIFGTLPPAHVSFYTIIRMGDASSSGSLVPVVLWIIALLSPLISRTVRARESAVLLFEASFLLLLAACSSSGLFGITPIRLDLIYPVLAVVLIDIAGIAVRAVSKDLAGFSFGWRQPAVILASVALVLSMASELPSVVSGRLGLPDLGYGSALSFLSGAPKGASVLWMGAPADLPVGSWRIANGLAVSVTPSNAVNQSAAIVPPRLEGASTVIADLKQAVSGQTVDLGSQLAALGIGYVVVPQQIGGGKYFLGSDLDLILERQLDLKQLLVDPSLVAFQVLPTLSVGAMQSGGQIISLLSFLAILVQLFVLGLMLLGLFRRRSFLLDADGEAVLRSIWRHLSPKPSLARRELELNRESGNGSATVEAEHGVVDGDSGVDELDSHEEVSGIVEGIRETPR